MLRGDRSHQLGAPGAFHDQTQSMEPRSSGHLEGAARPREEANSPPRKGSKTSSAKGSGGSPLSARPGGGRTARPVGKHTHSLGTHQHRLTSPPHVPSLFPNLPLRRPPPPRASAPPTPASSAPQPLSQEPPTPPHLLLGALGAAALLLEVLLVGAFHTLPQALGGTPRLLSAPPRGPRGP